jgi:hypothetical protein
VLGGRGDDRTLGRAREHAHAVLVVDVEPVLAVEVGDLAGRRVIDRAPAAVRAAYGMTCGRDRAELDLDVRRARVRGAEVAQAGVDRFPDLGVLGADADHDAVEVVASLRHACTREAPCAGTLQVSTKCGRGSSRSR